MTLVPVITIEHLIKHDLVHAEAAEKHRHKWPRLNEILAGAPGTEPDSTTLITMSGGTLEKALVDANVRRRGNPGGGP
ncbi:hypothetical protein [Paenarthrobacter sp. YJN-5]|uniref:hypothetical protein n=1 Tax=Paenarthrobacter sp. YJN-5 TaxID=2735316 RepID=UPI001878233F|nr:hypothetical protein [Paenarthrobacter sp. YJN-5]QOT19254.1 hypothetical protein HMI59_21325 [Paenarthrobacter sp. YJN-5]